MKHTLEKILEFGRTLFDAPSTPIGSNLVGIEVDYKVILMSNYVSRRVFELAHRPLEISFIYGGTVQRENDRTTLRLDSFYVPSKQKVTSSSFDGTPETTYDANRFFATQNKRIVAIGHSHADYDVFHSGTDLDNYKNLVGSIGVKVEHSSNSSISVTKSFTNLSSRLSKFFSVKKTSDVPSTFSYVLPSLIFNASGTCVDSAMAVKSYASIDGKVHTQFNLHDCNLRVYNKQAVLTDVEKKALDYSIRKVLSYNGYTTNSATAKI